MAVTIAIPATADVRLNIAVAALGTEPGEFRPLQDAVAVLVESKEGELLFKGDETPWLVVRAQEESLGLLQALPILIHIDEACIGWEPPCSTAPIRVTLLVSPAARAELLDLVDDFGGTASGETVLPDGDSYFDLTVPVEALEPIDDIEEVHDIQLDALPQLGGRLLRLGEGLRFNILSHWQTAETQADGQAIFLTRDTGAFHFFQPDNIELIVKVLDGCSVNGYYWVFISGLTNVGVSLQVISNYGSKTYENELGTTFKTVTDTAALPCS